MTAYDPERDDQHYDHQAEVALLSVCIASKNCRIEARKHLIAGDLFIPAHEDLYDVMGDLDKRGVPVDLTTVSTALGERFAGRTSSGRGDTLRAQHEACHAVLMMTVGYPGVAVPESAAAYAHTIRAWSLRRRLADEGRRITQRALTPSESPERMASEAVTRLTGLRDTGAGDVSAVTLRDLMAGEDDDPSWVVPGLLERGDRLMLTGSEGAGKSAFSRQIAVMSAAGLHPFTEALMPPVRTLILDAENKATQVRRQTRPLLRWLHDRGADDPMERVLIDAIYPRRINLLNDRDLSRVHQTIDTFRPDIVVIGPIYRMSPRALNTDDEAHPFLAALDTLCERGCTLIVEAHAGHAQEGFGKTQARSLRPRGSSALLGWPEFGLGLRGLGGGLADLEPWRGHREARAWPARLRQAPGNRWIETSPDDRPPAPETPPPPPPGWDEPDPTLV